MKKHIAFSTIIGALFLWASCAKNQLPIPPGGNSPQFYFHGTIGNDSVLWQAGNDNLFMNTDYFIDAQKIIVLRGELAPTNCSSCEPSLSIMFRDIAPAPDSVLRMNVASYFTNKQITSYSLDSIKSQGDKEEFSFQPITQQPINDILWDFGDGTQSTEDDPQHIFSGTGTRVVKLVIKQGIYTDSLSLPINIGFQSAERVVFTWTQNINNEVHAQAVPGNFTQYLWDAGDGQMPVGNPIDFTYTTPGIYTLSCLAQSGSLEARYYAKIKVPQLGSWANPNFTYTTKIVVDTTLVPRTNTGTAVLELKKNGKIYRSYKSNPSINQSGNIVVRSIDSSPFETNLNGQPTIGINMAVDTWLYNVQNLSDSVRIRSNKMRLAVAYPN